MSVEVLHPPGVERPRMLIVRTQVHARSIEEVHLANADEVATFATKKRHEEHLTGRWLLQCALEQWGIDSVDLMISRTQQRAPYLHYIPGLWKNTPLPSLSIGHASGWAYVALIEHGWRIGIDAEPSARGLQSNAFDLMSKGEELHTLRQSPEHAIELWVCKEAVQKTLGMGMHLNPREIVIPIGVANTIISIEKSKIQLINWQYQGTCIAVAFHQGTLDVTTPEDRLLEATRSAMQDGDWGVGCKTTSGRV